MTTAAPPLQEFIGYRRSAAVLGLEVLDAYRTKRDWRVIGSEYAVTVPQTWHGEVRYRGLTNAVEPGIAFCNQPGEALVATPAADRAGSFNVLLIQPALLDEWLSEQSARPIPPRFSAITKPISGGLIAKFRRLFAAFEPDTSDMELQSHAVEVSGAMIQELIAGASDAKLREGPAIRGTARMRECLNEEGLDIDLETLANRVGLSRFQALRAFKRRYGLPPHAYQLCLRISKARRLLLAGAPPADVAVHCGFVDQSHLNRHFKRIVGVTPMRYAQADAVSKRRSSGVYPVSPQVGHELAAVATRSDRRRDP
ncbi:MAG: AraC family transcriptional regulator [Pseudomonadota bacterium]